MQTQATQIVPTPTGGHTLPPLPYPYDALEPVIDEKTLRIHHDKHHKKYVDDLNKAELTLANARERGDYAAIKAWEKELAFNGSGHILHSLYWVSMGRPDSGGTPGTLTTRMIDWYFGSFARFKAQFSAAAIAVEGSGWCVLGYHPMFRRLEILQGEKHQNLTQWGTLPILVCDVWEHAYYLRYQNARDGYVDAWWRLVDWRAAEERLRYAAQLL
jgi:Fe-Mn family superoxide dismutase